MTGPRVCLGKIIGDDFVAWAKEHMVAYKYSRKAEFRETPPKALVGKILRRELREPLPS